MNPYRLLQAFAITLVMVAAGSFGRGTPKARRDWSRYPAVVEIDTDQDVYAVGDSHADPDRLAAVLAKAKIIKGVPKKPTDVKWAAGKSILVVTGDMIDKWHHSLDVIALLRALQTSAAADGGQVIITMGNHEGEFLADPHGDKTEEFGDELKEAGFKRNDVGDCQGDLGQFLCTLPIAARVNDWFFCHAGNTNGQTIQALSKSIENGFANDGFATPALIGDDSILEARLNDKGPNGLPWFDLGSLSTNPETVLAGYVKALGVKHLVQGHQPGGVEFPDGQKRSKDDLFQRYGLLFLIDTGMSQGVNGDTSGGGALHITGGSNPSAVALCANGKTKTLWDREKNSALEAIHCDK
ncbi:MAG TPA: metallophosphoesterase [Pyrinomonadaceae bacterium]|nr:metallophosphoesterase [Pyrinomonadaceae bacterium]